MYQGVVSGPQPRVYQDGVAVPVARPAARVYQEGTGAAGEGRARQTACPPELPGPAGHAPPARALRRTQEGMSASPTARSLARLRAEGYCAQAVERFCVFSRRRVDLFGVIDLVAVRAGEPVLGVQATTGSNAAARITKALAVPQLRAWLAAGAAFEVWAWSKRGPGGGRKTWQLTRRPLTLADLPAG